MRDSAVLNSGWQTLLLAIPFVLTMIAGVFRLDELFATHKQEPRKQRLLSGIDEDGQPILFDPDGRPSD